MVMDKIDSQERNKCILIVNSIYEVSSEYRFYQHIVNRRLSINKYIIVHDNILSKNCQKVESSMIGPSYLPGTYLMNFTIEKKKCRYF